MDRGLIDLSILEIMVLNPGKLKAVMSLWYDTDEE